MSVNGTLVEDKMRRFRGECVHFSFNKCPFYNDDSASVKFSTNSHETDNSVELIRRLITIHVRGFVPGLLPDFPPATLLYSTYCRLILGLDRRKREN